MKLERYPKAALLAFIRSRDLEAEALDFASAFDGDQVTIDTKRAPNCSRCRDTGVLEDSEGHVEWCICEAAAAAKLRAPTFVKLLNDHRARKLAGNTGA